MVPAAVDGSGPAAGGRITAAVILVYFALAVFPYWSYWHAGGPMIAAKGGDPATDAWFLAWTPYALAHGHNPLVTDWGNYPAGVNAITGIGMPLLGLIGAPVTAAFGAFVTTTLWFTLAFPLSATAGYVFVRHWVPDSTPAAFTGGLLYGYSPYLVAHGGSHLNLVFVPLPPLIFLVVAKIAAGAWPARSGFALGGMCAAQFLISAEVLASTAVMAAAGLATAALVHRPELTRDRVIQLARAAGFAALVVAVLLAYPLWLLTAGPGHVPGAVQTTALYRGDLLAPLIPDSAMLFRTAWSARLANTFSSGPGENGLYLGVPLLLVLAAGAVALRRRPAMRVAATVTGAAFVLSLGSRLVVGGHVVRAVPLPGAVFTWIPLLDNTIAARYALYVLLGAAVMLAMIMTAVRDRLSTPRQRLAAAAAVAAALVPLVPSWPYWLHITARVPAYFTSGQVTRIPSGSVALTLACPDPAGTAPMLWQVAAGMRFRTPSGRFVAPAQRPPAPRPSAPRPPAPDGSLCPPPAGTPAARAALTARLNGWHVRAVLVDGTAAPFIRWLLARPPDTTAGGIAAWYLPGT